MFSEIRIRVFLCVRIIFIITALFYYYNILISIYRSLDWSFHFQFYCIEVIITFTSFYSACNGVVKGPENVAYEPSETESQYSTIRSTAFWQSSKEHRQISAKGLQDLRWQMCRVFSKVEPDPIKKAKWWLVKDKTNYKTSGRTGNDIASAFVKILEKITGDNPEVKDIVTWSDSCVPLNRNSVMATAVADFLRRSPSFKTVTMKYSVPGHSQVQEVDNMHSNIERVCAVSEFYSPISFMRLLKSVHRQQPYKILLLSTTDFLNYQVVTKRLAYTKVPFSKVIDVQYNKEFPFIVRYKFSHTNSVYISISVLSVNCGTRSHSQAERLQIYPVVAFDYSAGKTKLSEAKHKDIKCMLRYISALDVEFYATILDSDNNLADLNFYLTCSQACKI